MKIICIGMNYHQHIAELGSKTPQEPVFFMKPDTALLRNNDPFYLPDFSEDMQYECELVVKINRVTKSIDERFAHRCYQEVGIGIDFTARDLQEKFKKAGLPWEQCKAFDHSAAVPNTFIDKADLPPISELNFWLDIDGQRRQTGAASDMIFSVDRVISYVSRFVTLKIGDLIFTGTPVGVSKLEIGQRLEGYLEGHKLLDFEIR